MSYISRHAVPKESLSDRLRRKQKLLSRRYLQRMHLEIPQGVPVLANRATNKNAVTLGWLDVH